MAIMKTIGRPAFGTNIGSKLSRPLTWIVFAAILFGCTGCAKCRPKNVICIGDSLTVCGQTDGRYTDYLAKWLPNETIINKGISGNTLADGRKRFQADVLNLNPDVVVIELGANDFLQMKRTIEQLKADLEDMVKRSRNSGAEVVIASCFGNRDDKEMAQSQFDKANLDFAKAIAAMELEIVEKYDCFYVPNMQEDIKPNGIWPYWEDYHHPNKQGNEFVAKRILAELKKALAKVKK